MQKTKPSTATFSRAAYNLARRFHPTGNADTNAGIRCDPSAILEVSDDVLESVDYDRPRFNWPSAESSENSCFVLDGMAVGVLKKTGFSREAMSLSFLLDHCRPSGVDLPSAFHRYLDFSPVDAESPEIAQMKQLAVKAGLDPASISQMSRSEVRNPLAHESSTMAAEWAWLVANADVRSPFGKTAACELAPSAIAALSSRWLVDMLAPPPASPPKPDNPILGNRAWFEKTFPQGWIHVDHLSESAIVSAPISFPARMALLMYEVVAKGRRGMPSDTALYLAFRHVSAPGVNGSAFLASAAFDFFHKHVVAEVSPSRRLMTPCGGSSAVVEPALTTYLQALNPGIQMSDEFWAWHAYRHFSPQEAAVVEESWLSRNDGEVLLPAKNALMEKLGLQGAGLAFIVPPEGLALSQAALPRRGALRI